MNNTINTIKDMNFLCDESDFNTNLLNNKPKIEPVENNESEIGLVENDESEIDLVENDESEIGLVETTLNIMIKILMKVVAGVQMKIFH
ncbi:hypothetical protein F8M41_018236 [Gigaspora margarita]|uniref:Uncharacterized protein n=1 Tax=Gigaspora margarita TaxID=4874 RepID=A0A8H4ALU1_GIGMA|nr:hypothetical protein F8M41_018236 [Gigaspora margarita]